MVPAFLRFHCPGTGILIAIERRRRILRGVYLFIPIGFGLSSFKLSIF